MDGAYKLNGEYVHLKMFLPEPEADFFRCCLLGCLVDITG